MKPTLLILRPQPGADRTAQAAQARGFGTVVAPLFEVRAVDWKAPDPAQFDALILTSANAVRQAGAELDHVRTLPTYAVGEATALVARAAGLTVRVVGDSDADDLLARAAGDGNRRLLHLAGREHRTADHAGITVTRRIVYASEAAISFPDAARQALGDGAVALLHSSRAAELFRSFCADAALYASHIPIAVLSPQVAATAGEGWAAIAVASRPTDDALLAAAARVCDG